MNMNQKNLNIIYGVVIVVLIGAVVYFAVGKKSEPVSNPVVNNDTNNPINTSPSVTASWNKYSNDKFGFEIKYPSDYIPHLVNATSGAADNNGTKIVFLKTNEKIGSVSYLVIEYGDNKRVSYLSDPSIKLVESKGISVDGISGTQDKFNGPCGTWVTVYLNKGGIIYSITPNQNLANFSQTLSTFKFTK